MLGFARPVSLLCVFGGGLWLVSYVALFAYPSMVPDAIRHNAWAGMELGALLLAAALIAVLAEAGTSRILRSVGLGCLFITAALTLLWLLPLPLSGEEDLAWGVLDLELLVWIGYVSFMAAMTLLSIAASRTARSPLEILGWVVAIICAGGQAVLMLVELSDSTRIVGEILAIPIVLFGVAWIAIGMARFIGACATSGGAGTTGLAATTSGAARTSGAGAPRRCSPPRLNRLEGRRTFQGRRESCAT
jgi:hypothetical protein